MKKFIIVLLSFLNFSCVSSSKYQQLFDEHQVAIAKNQKNIQDIEILERSVNILERDITTKKNEINNLNYYLKQANDKNTLNEESIKKLNEQLQIKNNELLELNEKFNALKNENIKEENNEEKNHNYYYWEQTDIHKNYLKDLERINNFKLYAVLVSNLGLDFYWDFYGDHFISDINNKNKSLNELRKIADKKRKENISENKNIRLNISNLNSDSEYYDYSNLGSVFIGKISTSFSNGNTNLQAQLCIVFSEQTMPTKKTTYGEDTAFYSPGSVNCDNDIMDERFIISINIENNKIYQLFVDAEKSNNITYMDISINMKGNIKKKKSFYGKQTVKDLVDIKINKIYFAYPTEIKTLDF